MLATASLVTASFHELTVAAAACEIAALECLASLRIFLPACVSSSNWVVTCRFVRFKGGKVFTMPYSRARILEYRRLFSLI